MSGIHASNSKDSPIHVKGGQSQGSLSADSPVEISSVDNWMLGDTDNPDTEPTFVVKSSTTVAEKALSGNSPSATGKPKT